MKENEEKFLGYALLRKMRSSETTFYNIVNDYAEAINCPEKQLWYYLRKWNDKGIIDCGVSIGMAWFEEDKIAEIIKLWINRENISQAVKGEVRKENNECLNM